MRHRRKARALVLQALFSLRKNPKPLAELFEDDLFVNAAVNDREFAIRVIEGVLKHQKDLDDIISGLSENWNLKRIAAVDHVVLWIALFEMIHCEDIPAAVSINEAIDLAKKYSTEDSGRFINGLLDKYHKSVLKK